MNLRTDMLDTLSDVETTDIERIFAEESFREFIVLENNERFIQAGNEWSNTEECLAFGERTDSEPFVLEYRDGQGKLFRANGWVTLDQVREALLSYRRGEADWRNFVWVEFKL